jgi:DNA-binding response OmpR family regulator
VLLSTEVSQVPKHILVVDDSLDLIGAYREVLQEQGYDVSTATGGDERWRRSVRGNSTC